MSKNLILPIQYGGLGDHLFFSHIPEIVKKRQLYDRVFISNKSPFNNLDTKKLVWDLNPYIDGFTDEPYTPNPKEHFMFHNYDFKTKNIYDYVLQLLDIEMDEFCKKPKTYYNATRYSEFDGVVLVDLSFKTNAGVKLDYEAIKSHLSQHEKVYFLNNKLEFFNHYPNVVTRDIFGYIDCLYSCKRIYTVVSGTSQLAQVYHNDIHVFVNKSVMLPAFYLNQPTHVIHCPAR